MAVEVLVLVVVVVVVVEGETEAQRTFTLPRDKGVLLVDLPVYQFFR